DGSFTVSGSHTYAERWAARGAGTDTHDAASPASASKSFTVSDPSVVVGAQTISASEGSSTGTVTTAIFTDPGGPEAVADYSASIAWGDGSSTSPATITANLDGSFTVSGSHTYAE